MNDNTPKVYLSRRNLLALLSKLDRQLAGQETAATVIKYKQPSSSYQQTMETIAIIAVEDEEYYASQNRPAGEMLSTDEQHLPKPSTGTTFNSIFNL
jgi:hypothetical protein